MLVMNGRQVANKEINLTLNIRIKSIFLHIFHRINIIKIIIITYEPINTTEAKNYYLI
jgi:hypothetical protein